MTSEPMGAKHLLEGRIRPDAPAPLRVAINGYFLQVAETGTGEYLRRLVAAMLPLAGSCGVELALIAPRSTAGVDAPLLVQAPRLGGDAGKVEFEHWTFPRRAQGAGFHLAHIPHFGPPLCTEMPTVVTVHDLIPLVLPAYRGSLLVRAYTLLASAGARRARIVIADSYASRRDIVARLGIPPERVRVIYLAPDANYHPVADPSELERVRARYSLPERFILYLGGFDVRKNVRLAVEAFSALREERAGGWRLVVAGRLPKAGSDFLPDPRVNAPAEVQFIGPPEQADKPALYSAASAFVFPSFYEGFGLPPLEAMACGTPVLASNAASLPEVVGEGGLLLDPGKPEEWSAALHTLLNDPQRQADLRTRGTVQAKKFSWDRAARETLEVYRQAV